MNTLTKLILVILSCVLFVVGTTQVLNMIREHVIESKRGKLSKYITEVKELDLPFYALEIHIKNVGVYRIAVQPFKYSHRRPHENIIITPKDGNSSLVREFARQHVEDRLRGNQ